MGIYYVGFRVSREYGSILFWDFMGIIFPSSRLRTNKSERLQVGVCCGLRGNIWIQGKLTLMRVGFRVQGEK